MTDVVIIWASSIGVPEIKERQPGEQADHGGTSYRRSRADCTGHASSRALLPQKSARAGEAQRRRSQQEQAMVPTRAAGIVASIVGAVIVLWLWHGWRCDGESEVGQRACGRDDPDSRKPPHANMQLGATNGGPVSMVGA
jgi:hypothetical protein